MNAATLARLFVLSYVNERRNDPKRFYNINENILGTPVQGLQSYFVHVVAAV